MQPTPSPSASRGDAVVQPAYFTSALYVDAVRKDMENLVQLYKSRYCQLEFPITPFALFKELWCSQGWNWLHFKIFNNRSRETFLLVTMRLFLERLTDDDILTRVIGLFCAYTFYQTQPSASAPHLWRINHIPIPLDHFTELISLEDKLVTPDLKPLHQYVLHLSSLLVRNNTFYILPSSQLGAENPRELPREIVVNQVTPTVAPESSDSKKKGRPSKRDKAKKARAALAGLNQWLGDSSNSSNVPILPLQEDEFVRYQADKTALLSALGNSGQESIVRNANVIILERLREVQAIQEGESDGSQRFAGLERVEQAVSEITRVDGPGVLTMLTSSLP